MLGEIIDHLVEEKMDYKEYMKMADESDEEKYRDMFKMIAEQEHTHYKMLKEYLEQIMEKEEEQ